MIKLFINRFWIEWLIDWLIVGHWILMFTGIQWGRRRPALHPFSEDSTQVCYFTLQYKTRIYRYSLNKHNTPGVFICWKIIPPPSSNRSAFRVFIFENKYHNQVINRCYKFHYFGFPYLQKSLPPPHSVDRHKWSCIISWNG